MIKFLLFGLVVAFFVIVLVAGALERGDNFVADTLVPKVLETYDKAVSKDIECKDTETKKYNYEKDEMQCTNVE